MGDLRDNSRRPLAVLRNEVIERLKLNFAHGNLDEDELDARLSEATGASSELDLIRLTSDLPDIREEGAAAAPGAHSGVGIALNRGRVKEHGTLVSLLSGTLRKGAWKPPRRLQIVAFMGGVDLDFTQAVLAPGTTEIFIFALMGGVDIKVPPGINVDMSGLPIMGGFDDRSDGIVDDRAPTLRLRGVVVMGGVEVRTVRSKRSEGPRPRSSNDRGGLSDGSE